jgi:hypothetical protein
MFAFLRPFAVYLRFYTCMLHSPLRPCPLRFEVANVHA